uniref:Ku_PK_bind domain-containing protein n=1 Tax=Caenorhabditis tropicalis TaxID=1561998 RepID=A0A1I7TRK4_9PELO
MSAHNQDFVSIYTEMLKKKTDVVGIQDENEDPRGRRRTPGVEKLKENIMKNYVQKETEDPFSAMFQAIDCLEEYGENNKEREKEIDRYLVAVATERKDAILRPIEENPVVFNVTEREKRILKKKIIFSPNPTEKKKKCFKRRQHKK